MLDWNLITLSKVSDADSHNLSLSFSNVKIFVALNQMGLGKSPGLGGFMVEFYRTYWLCIMDSILSSFNAIVLIGLVLGIQSLVLSMPFIQISP